MPETEGEKGAGAEPRQRLYIMTLTVLAAYRRRGIGMLVAFITKWESLF
jgi:ribosomal protein S18 acetylase RimI-like enzyme